MSNRKGIELLRYAVHMLSSSKEDVNMRFSAPQLLRIADAVQKCEWDFYPDQWSERQLQECVQFGMTPKWEDKGDGRGPVPVYFNDADDDHVFRVAVTWMATAEVEVNAPTLEAAIEWAEGDMPTPKDHEYLDDSFEVDNDTTKEIQS